MFIGVTVYTLVAQFRGSDWILIEIFIWIFDIAPVRSCTSDEDRSRLTRTEEYAILAPVQLPNLYNKRLFDLTVFHDGYLSPGCRYDKPDCVCHLGNPGNRRVSCPVTVGDFQWQVVNNKMPP